MSQKPHSPPCSAAAADDAYMGYADRDELIAAFSELLAAWQGSAWEAPLNHPVIDTAADGALVQKICADAAHCHLVLTQELRRLGGTPTTTGGGFRGTDNPGTTSYARLERLAEEQAWMVDKLALLRRRARDDALHHILGELLQIHRQNLALLSKLLHSAH